MSVSQRLSAAERGELTRAQLAELVADCTLALEDATSMSDDAAHAAAEDLWRAVGLYRGGPRPTPRCVPETDVRRSIGDAAVGHAALGSLIDALAELDPAGRGLTAAQIVDAIHRSPKRKACQAARDALLELSGLRAIDTRSIGKTLASYRLRVVGGRYIEARTWSTSKRAARWVVRSAFDETEECQAIISELDRMIPDGSHTCQLADLIRDADSPWFPRAANALSLRLRELAPALRRIGVTFSRHRQPGTGRVLFTFSRERGQ